MIKKITYILFVHCLLGTGLMHASLKLYPRTRADGSVPPTRAMIIALDESEKKGLGPVTYNVLVALLQQSCPVLVSTSVIKHLLTPDPLTDLVKKEIMESQPYQYSSVTSDYVLKNFFAKKFAWAAFDIYLVNPSLLLFIPHAYTKSLGKLPPPAKNFDSHELLLGLKVNHLRKITFEHVQKIIADYKGGIPSKYFGKDALYGGKNPLESTTIESALFITSASYEDKHLIPQWVFYLIGHATEQSLHDSQIAGLNVGWFRFVLKFLNSQITTKLLMYISCYSAGSYSDLLYKNPINPAVDQYQFPIVTAGIANLMTSVAHATTSDASGSIIFSIRFDLFFQRAIADDPIGYEQIIPLVFTGLNYLLPSFDKQLQAPVPFNPYNFPLIRPAGRDFFVPLVSVLHITPIMIAQRTKPLDIQQYAHSSNALTDRLYSMLDVETVPFPLILRRSKVAPVIASSLANTSQLVQLQTDYSLQELLQERVFIGGPGSTPFFIHTFISNSGERYTNVIITLNTIDQRIFLQAFATNEHGDVIFIAEDKIRPVTADERKIYREKAAVIISQEPSKKSAEQIRHIRQVTIPLTNQLLVDAIANLDVETVQKFLLDYTPVIDQTVRQRIQEMEHKEMSKEQGERLSRIKEVIDRYQAQQLPIK